MVMVVHFHLLLSFLGLNGDVSKCFFTKWPCFDD